jgi:hypothetical protein
MHSLKRCSNHDLIHVSIINNRRERSKTINAILVLYLFFFSSQWRKKTTKKYTKNTFDKQQKVIKYFWQNKSKISLKDYVKCRKINKTTGTGFLEKRDGIKNVKCIGGPAVAIQFFDNEHDRSNSKATKYDTILLCHQCVVIYGIVQ